MRRILTCTKCGGTLFRLEGIGRPEDDKYECDEMLIVCVNPDCKAEVVLNPDGWDTEGLYVSHPKNDWKNLLKPEIIFKEQDEII